MSSHFNKTVFESQCMYPLEIVYEVDKKLTIKFFFFLSPLTNSDLLRGHLNHNICFS